MRHSLIAVVLLALCLFDIPEARAFVFSAVAGTRKCFGEELVEGLRYEVRTKMSRSLGAFVVLTMTAPDKQAIFESHGAENEMTHLMEARVTGVHTVCFTFGAQASQVSTSNDVSLEIEDVNDAEARKNLEESMLEKNVAPNGALVQAQYIQQSMQVLLREYTYLKEREAMMRDTNESTNTRTWSVTLLTMLAVLAVSYVRHYKLRRFLVTKKLLD